MFDEGTDWPFLSVLLWSICVYDHFFLWAFPSLTDVYIMLLTSLYDIYSLQTFPQHYHLHLILIIKLTKLDWSISFKFYNKTYHFVYLKFSFIFRKISSTLRSNSCFLSVHLCFYCLNLLVTLSLSHTHTLYVWYRRT